MPGNSIVINMRNSRNAFSLIEIMVVIGIGVLMAAVMLPGLIGNRDAKELTGFADRIRSTLEEVRTKSMQNIEGKTWSVRFVNTVTSSYYEFLGNGVSYTQYALPPSVVFYTSSVPVSGTKTIAFTPLSGGSAATSVTIYQKSNPLSMKVISVNAFGIVTVKNPSELCEFPMQPPSVNIITPSVGPLGGTQVTISANVSDPAPGSAIKEARFYWLYCPSGVCGTENLIGTDPTSPYSAVWVFPDYSTCGSMPDDRFRIAVYAEDVCGNVSLPPAIVDVRLTGRGC
jgi:type II secretory pathway pseudopilin PulG